MNKGILIGAAVGLLIIVIWFVGGGSETKAIYYMRLKRTLLLRYCATNSSVYVI